MKLQGLIKAEGIDTVLQEICKFSPGEILALLVKEMREKLRKGEFA
ncbi:MAG: hypothetical protein GXO71_04085 [Caldiserica bacterium]|nr:hypothetical protein [Caldisericota bacterium]